MQKIGINNFVLIQDGADNVGCTPPFSLRSLFASDEETESIYYRDNILAKKHIDSRCSFISDIEIDATTFSMKYAFLRLNGIYADAEVFFNGKSFGRVHNYNRIYTFDVADLLKIGVNRLEIRCNKPLSEKRLISLPDVTVPSYELAPHITDVGLIGECFLMAGDSIMIDKIGVSQRHESAERVNVDISLATVGACENLRALATLVSPSGKMYFGGITDGQGTVTVTNPELWWPRGLGNPSLYHLTVTLYVGETLEDIYETDIGLRNVELRTEEDAPPALYINGSRFFPLGATYVREDSVIPFITDSRIERIISSAADANMNTIRILGEGLYPSDTIYRLCDRYGIAVFQDISVPYVRPPVADAFASGITAEFSDVMSRISHHPSLFLTYLAVIEKVGSDVPASHEAVLEFAEICYSIFRGISKRYASDLPFVMNPRPIEDADESARSYEHTGLYSHCFISLPAMESIYKFIGDGTTNILAPEFECHSSHRGAITDMLTNMSCNFRYPYDFEALVYTSQIASGYSVQKSVTESRLSPSGRSAVCRQLNDSWPSISSSGIDYYGRRKALHYYAKEAFAPIFASAILSGLSARFAVSNMTGKEFSGALIYSLYDRDDNCILEKSVDVSVSPFTLLDIDTYDFSTLVFEKRNYYILVELKVKTRRIFKSLVLFVPPKSFEFKNPNIKVEILGKGRDYEMLLSAARMAMGVEISFYDIDADFSSNYLTLTPGYPEKITIKTDISTTKEKLIDRLRIRSVYNIGK